MPRLGTQQKETKGRGAKLGSVYTPKDRSDLPEYIKGEELARISRFTIYAGKETKGMYGDRINFQIAYKNESGGIEKKVFTVSTNEERLEILHLVRQNHGLTDCRLVKLLLGSATYWKIIDADAPLPEEAVVTSSQGETELRDEDIPF